MTLEGEKKQFQQQIQCLKDESVNASKRFKQIEGEFQKKIKGYDDKVSELQNRIENQKRESEDLHEQLTEAETLKGSQMKKESELLTKIRSLERRIEGFQEKASNPVFGRHGVSNRESLNSQVGTANDSNPKQTGDKQTQWEDTETTGTDSHRPRSLNLHFDESHSKNSEGFSSEKKTITPAKLEGELLEFKKPDASMLEQSTVTREQSMLTREQTTTVTREQTGITYKEEMSPLANTSDPLPPELNPLRRIVEILTHKSRGEVSIASRSKPSVRQTDKGTQTDEGSNYCHIRERYQMRDVTTEVQRRDVAVETSEEPGALKEEAKQRITKRHSFAIQMAKDGRNSGPSNHSEPNNQDPYEVAMVIKSIQKKNLEMKEKDPTTPEDDRAPPPLGTRTISFEDIRDFKSKKLAKASFKTKRGVLSIDLSRNILNKVSDPSTDPDFAIQPTTYSLTSRSKASPQYSRHSPSRYHNPEKDLPIRKIYQLLGLKSTRSGSFSKTRFIEQPKTTEFLTQSNQKITESHEISFEPAEEPNQEREMRKIYNAVAERINNQPELKKIFKQVARTKHKDDDDKFDEKNFKVDYDIFQEYYNQLVLSHKKCGEDCPHLKRFYQKIGYFPSYVSRPYLHLKQTDVEKLPRIHKKMPSKNSHKDSE